MDEKSLQTAARILNAGGVVILPTDTVYGIAAHPGHPEAIHRIQCIKGRPSDKPIALLASDRQAVSDFGAVFPETAKRLADAYWPGALTLVLPCRGTTEGFRVPDCEPTRQLLRLCGGVLRVTSANLSGRQPAVSAAETLRGIGLEADLVIDGGISPGGVASTVVRFDGNGEPVILREGAISRSELMEQAGKGIRPA